MKSIFYILFATIVFSGCNHPEDKTYERNQKVDMSEFYGTDKNSSTSNSSYAESENSQNQDVYNGSVVHMQRINGIYEIPIKINGIPMHFIFDTGASTISISMVEVAFLYKEGKLSQDDIMGKTKFVDATGHISEGAIINIGTVQIGDRTLHNVRASVVANMKAPLLIGQSALERFGKITIDYENDEIIFK